MGTTSTWSRALAVTLVLALVGPGAAADRAGRGAQGEQPPAGTTPAPPRGAQKTLMCKVFTGPNRVERADATKRQAAKATGLKDWYIVHGETESTLYHGYYAAFNDPTNAKDKERARRDRERVAAVTDAGGDRPFASAIFVDIDAPDPDAPPEWNLANKDKDKPRSDPAKAYWSLQVAAYLDSPDRKQAAVDSVRDMRANGIEAYYYHGPVISSVTVGAWPQSAAFDEGRGKDPRLGVQAPRPDRPVALFSAPLNRDVPSEVRTTDGQVADAAAPKVLVYDDGLADAMKRYPRHAINGEYHARTSRDPATGRQSRRPDTSFLVVLPTWADDDAAADAALTRGAGLPTDADLPDAPTGGGTGLKRLEE